MAFDLLSALGGIGSQEEYQARDPYFLAGQNVINTRLPTAETNAQAIFGPVLQGFLGGALGGYGQNQARQSMFNDYMASPLREQNIGPLASGRDYASLLSTVGNPTTPSVDWNPESSRAQLLMGALAKQSQMESEQKAEAIRAELAAKTSPEAIQGAMQLAQATSLGDTLGKGVGGGNKVAQELEKEMYGRITKLPTYTKFADIEPNFKAIIDLAKQDTKAADIGLIATIARLRDPGSTVREGEFKINSETQSYLDTVFGNWRSTVAGKSQLKPEAKQALIASVAPQYNQTGTAYQSERQKLIDALVAQGGNPSNIPTLDFTPFDLTTKTFGGATKQVPNLTKKTSVSNLTDKELDAMIAAAGGG